MGNVAPLRGHSLRKLSNEKHSDLLNDRLREKYRNALQQYKKVLNRKRGEYYTYQDLSIRGYHI